MVRYPRFVAVSELLPVVVLFTLSWLAISCNHPAKQTSAVTVTKQPFNFAIHTFDPLYPPPDMPPLNEGDNAVCDSNFLSNASVSGETRQTDGTHANVTITHINMNLQLNLAIWLPHNATPHVTEHEEGHRQISEYYYQTADKLAEQIAKLYIGKQVEISGADLQDESNNFLQQTAAAIAADYSRELNPGPTQLLFDSITDHSRNQVNVNDAVAHAIANAPIESP